MLRHPLAGGGMSLPLINKICKAYTLERECQAGYNAS